MLKRRKSGRPLVLALAIATLAPLLGGQALNPPAQATWSNSFQCPLYYNEQTSDEKPGVTVCSGVGAHEYYQLIAVDLTEGAKLRVVSDVVSGAPSGDAEFDKRSMPEWKDWIEDSHGPLTPAPSRLAAVVNTGFLVDADSATTPLSLPEKIDGTIKTRGYAGSHWEDPAWSMAPKFSLRLGFAGNPGPQIVHNGMFGDPLTGHYTNQDVDDHFDTYTDGTVGYPSWKAPSDGNVARNRTFAFRQSWHDWAGHDMFFILVYHGGIFDGVTLSQMDAEIQHILGGWWPDWTIQFDGGRSTSLCTTTFCHSNMLTREVPEVLAIYESNED